MSGRHLFHVAQAVAPTGLTDRLPTTALGGSGRGPATRRLHEQRHARPTMHHLNGTSTWCHAGGATGAVRLDGVAEREASPFRGRVQLLLGKAVPKAFSEVPKGHNTNACTTQTVLTNATRF